MANYQILKADIDKKIYENAQQKITGENLNSVLNAMVATLGAEYQFAGIATIDTNPETSDAKVFYIANGKGTYTNLGGIEVTEDDVVILYYDTSWHKVATGIASNEKLSELESKTLHPTYSNSSLQCRGGGVTDLLPLVVNKGDYIICKITGNTSIKSISLWSETEIVDKDIIAYENGNNGNIIIKAKNDSTHFKVFSDTRESINIAFFVVKDKIEREYSPSLLDVVYSGVLTKDNSGVVNYTNVMEGLNQDDVIFIQANKLNGSTVYLSLLNGTSIIAEDILVISDSSETSFRIPSSCDGIRLYSAGASSISLGISKCLQPTINSLESDNDSLPLSAAQGKKLKQLVYNTSLQTAYSNTSLQCIRGSVTELLPLVVNNGDYLICKITGNTGTKAISLYTETAVVDEDIIRYESGNNGNIIIKAKNNTTHFKIFSDIAESINIAFFVVKDKIEKENIIDAFGKEYGSYIMTTFYNDTQRLRVLVSSNGKHFTEIVTNKDINNGEPLRDPDLVKVGEYYYIAITGAQLKIYKTKDFVNYSLHTTINPAIENRTYYWAPEIFKDIDGKKYLIFAGYYMPQDAEKYIVTQYIAEMSDDMTTLIGTPSILELPGVSTDYQFDTTVCYIDGKYYAACFGKSLVIYRSDSLINGYEEYKQVSLEKALPEDNYFEGPSIIHDSKYIYIYVTQNYPGFVPNVDTKAIGVYVFDMEWNYIGFSWCENVVDYPNYGTSEDNKIIGEHPKVLPVTNEIIAKITSSI